MANERTLSIIKPDATKRNLTGKINAKFEDAGLRIVAQKRIHLTKAQAGVFYGVHAERPFYDELCEFMASEPVVVQVLEGEGAIAKTAKSWVQPTLPMRLPVQSALNSLNQLAKTRFTGQTLQTQPLRKSRISSRVSSWSAKRHLKAFLKTRGLVARFFMPAGQAGSETNLRAIFDHRSSHALEMVET